MSSPHYAKTLGSRQIYLTDTERSDGVTLSEAIDDLYPNADVPVIVRVALDTWRA